MTRRGTSRSRSNVLKDSASVSKVQEKSILNGKLDKAKTLELFLRDFNNRVADHEKNLEKSIAQFCKSIYSVYDMVLHKIPKEYHNMKIEDYLAYVGQNNLEETLNIDNWLSSQFGINPTKHPKGSPRKKRKKITPSIAKFMHKSSDDDDDDDYKPNFKLKSEARGRPPKEKLSARKRSRNDENNSSVKNGPRMMLRSSALKKSNPRKSRPKDKSGVINRDGANSTTKRRRDTMTPSSSVECIYSSMSPAYRGTSQARTYTKSRVASKKNSHVAKSGKKRRSSVTKTANTPFTLICPLHNGTSLNIDLNTDFKSLPLNNELIENLRIFKQKLSGFLDSTVDN